MTNESNVSAQFWEAHVAQLKIRLADQSAEFIRTASLEEIEQYAGEDFLTQSFAAKDGILAMLRQTVLPAQAQAQPQVA